MKRFKWCPEVVILKCKEWIQEPHAHICIRTPGAEVKHPQCDGDMLFLEFVDLEPQKIRDSHAFEDDPASGQKLIDDCMNENQAKQIVEFVESCMDSLLIVVNCEAGVSRSPGVVLAMRAKYGGDMEECHKRAYPNLHVANLLGKQMNVDPFKRPPIDATGTGINFF